MITHTFLTFTYSDIRSRTSKPYDIVDSFDWYICIICYDLSVLSTLVVFDNPLGYL